MELLLDTHAFVWFLNGEKQLSLKARKAIEDINNNKYLSIASLWEIAIKMSLGKLKLNKPYRELNKFISENGFEILPVTFDHAMTVSTLPFHHRDPFDRIIAAQTIVEDFTVVTKDENIAKYTNAILW